MDRKLGKQNAKVLSKAVQYLAGMPDAWVDTADIANHCKVKPVVIRTVLAWEQKQPGTCVERLKVGARLVQWRWVLEKATKRDQQAVFKERPELSNPAARKEHPDDNLITDLANVLGQKESYRQALRKIGIILYEEFGDIRLSELY